MFNVLSDHRILECKSVIFAKYNFLQPVVVDQTGEFDNWDWDQFVRDTDTIMSGITFEGESLRIWLAAQVQFEESDVIFACQFLNSNDCFASLFCRLQTPAPTPDVTH
jgi:hypothetical protein